MKLFQKLGEEIEEIWRDKNYAEDEFPHIAEQALKKANLPEKVSAWEVVEWTLQQTNLPDQRDIHGNFGDPPITLYNSPRFHADVYFWLEGTTAIHQHAFCGAFQVLHGSSIHSWYEFDLQESVNTFTEIGEMSLNWTPDSAYCWDIRCKRGPYTRASGHSLPRKQITCSLIAGSGANLAVAPVAVGSENGGKASAVLLSLVQSCRNLGINPQIYLEDVLRRIMGHPARQIDELLPDRWLAAKQEDAATHSPDQDGVS